MILYKLIEITPKEWGLLVQLSEAGMVDLDKVKTAMKDIANSRLGFAKIKIKQKS